MDKDTGEIVDTLNYIVAHMATKQDLAELRNELRFEMHEGFADIRQEMKEGFASVRADIREDRSRIAALEKKTSLCSR